MRLIDTEKAWKKAQRIYSDPVLLHAIKNVLDSTETVEAAPVVHGRRKKRGKNLGECSECGEVVMVRYRCCPDCGAKMDGEGKAPATHTAGNNHRVCKRCNTAVIGMEEYAECPECGQPFEEVANA